MSSRLDHGDLDDTGRFPALGADGLPGDAPGTTEQTLLWDLQDSLTELNAAMQMELAGLKARSVDAGKLLARLTQLENKLEDIGRRLAVTATADALEERALAVEEALKRLRRWVVGLACAAAAGWALLISLALHVW